jgi:putative hydrolase of the HAD superfamily
MVKGIIFDMVGPLLQKKPGYVFDEVIETAEKMRSLFPNDKEFVQALGKNEITKGYSKEEIAEKIVSKYQKIPGIWSELLPKLKGSYSLGVINNGTAITIPYFKKENNFDEFFSIFINSSEVGIEKPDSRIYLMALGQMRLKPEETIFIDDTEENVFGAEKIGMRGILFTNYQNLLIDLRSLGINI